MGRDRIKTRIENTRPTRTTSSGTSGDSGTSCAPTPEPLKTTATVDLGQIHKGEPNGDQNTFRSLIYQYIHKHRREIDFIITIISVLFQIVLLCGILVLAYIFIKPLYHSVIVPFLETISNQNIDLNKGVYFPLIIGVLSSILATFFVLITREFYYCMRDKLPAGALFRGVARVSTRCLIYILRMKDLDEQGKFKTFRPNYPAVNDPPTGPNDELRQNTPWVTGTPEAQALALILNVLGRVGRSENIEVAFPDVQFDEWNAPIFSLGGNWKTMRALETCNPYFKYQNEGFSLLPTKQDFRPSSQDEDIGLLQKMINPSNGLPVWIAMGHRGAGTISAAYALVRWWRYFGKLYGSKPFGLLVAFDDQDGWQQSRIISLYPRPKWHALLRHPYAWNSLRKRIKYSETF